jgi:hypothetical protein
VTQILNSQTSLFNSGYLYPLQVDGAVWVTDVICAHCCWANWKRLSEVLNCFNISADLFSRGISQNTQQNYRTYMTYEGSSKSFCTLYFATIFYWWLKKQNRIFFYIISLLFNAFFGTFYQLFIAIITDGCIHPYWCTMFFMSLSHRNLLPPRASLRGPNGENQMASNLNCELDVPLLPLKFLEVFQLAGHSMGTGRPLTVSLFS